jgi:hypothetical protein
MQTRSALQLACILGLVLLLLASNESQYHFFGGLTGSRPASHRELATMFLGQYLATQYSGKKVIVLSNPFSVRPGQPVGVYQFEKAGLRGLRRGLGTRTEIEQVVFPELKPGLLEHPHAATIDPHTTTPLSYMVTDQAVDRIARQYPKADVVVSLIGLPANIRETQAWKQNSGRVFALLLPDLRMIGDQTAVRQSILSGKLAAIILNKPGAPPEDQSLGRNATVEFEQRFLLITPGNVDHYLQIYPQLF